MELFLQTVYIFHTIQCNAVKSKYVLYCTLYIFTSDNFFLDTVISSYDILYIPQYIWNPKQMKQICD